MVFHDGLGFWSDPCLGCWSQVFIMKVAVIQRFRYIQFVILINHYFEFCLDGLFSSTVTINSCTDLRIKIFENLLYGQKQSQVIPCKSSKCESSPLSGGQSAHQSVSKTFIENFEKFEKKVFFFYCYKTVFHCIIIKFSS